MAPQARARRRLALVALAAVLACAACDRATPTPVAAAVGTDLDRIDIAVDGSVRWNGRAVGDAQLPVLLKTVASMIPQPQLRVVSAPGTAPAAVGRVMAAVQRAGVTQLRAVGNGTYAN